MISIIFSLLAMITAFILNSIATSHIIRISHSRKWYDLPDQRKIHTGFIPRLGGIGIFISFIITSLLIAGIYRLIKGSFVGILNLQFLPLFIAFAIIFALGLVDDFRNLRARTKLVFQIAAAAIVIFSGFVLKSITLPFVGTISLGWVGFPITFLWIIGVTNAVNLIDGMDGLAGGIGGFAALAMGIISLIQGSVGTAIISFSLFGAMAGFLALNLPPAKIFMGDGGSLVLGFVLSVIPFMGATKTPTFGSIIIPITLLIVPIVDTMGAILRRLKEGRGIMSPDRGHIHHKLLDMGFNEKKILVLIYSICFYLGMIAVTSVIMPKESNIYVVLFVWVGCIIGYSMIQFTSSRSAMPLSKTPQSQKKQNTA